MRLHSAEGCSFSIFSCFSLVAIGFNFWAKNRIDQNFVFCARGGLNLRRNDRAFFGSSRLKSESVLEKINPGNQKTLFPLFIGGVKCKLKLNVKF